MGKTLAFTSSANCAWCMTSEVAEVVAFTQVINNSSQWTAYHIREVVESCRSVRSDKSSQDVRTDHLHRRRCSLTSKSVNKAQEIVETTYGRGGFKSRNLPLSCRFARGKGRK